ncbi:MAG: protein kinase [Acidobacteria bacterium]|nr:protein kinase [Acidobacteriota bacterium]
MNPPQSIGQYRIVSKLGEGGMGVVYRAADTKLHREVALKILPPAFAEDAARMARFHREAQVLASLNHPNIAAIYGVEENTIVMELVEGAELKGPVAIGTAIDYARQIAAGLEAAHEKGVIHRDLKPANVRVTPDGVVKIIDFGLAAGPIRETADAANAPTLAFGPTLDGMILGTAPYMSPEQARGAAVDKRTDIWAFGAVLLEMLTGRIPFPGETVSDVLAAVLRADIDFSSLPAATPPAVRLLLERCMQRDPRQRLRDIGEARIALSGDLAPPAPAATPPGRRPALWPAAVGVLALALAATSWRLWTAPAAGRPMIQLEVDAGQIVHMPSISPDGERIVFVRVNEKGTHLAMRRLDQTNISVLAGTEAAMFVQPFFSPDGRSVGFFTKEKMKLLSLDGGSLISLAAVNEPAGGSWGADGRIAVVPATYTASGIWRIPAAGGSLESWIPSSAAVDTIDPHLLPHAKGLIYTTRESWPAYHYTLRILESGQREPRELLKNANAARYLDGGYLLFHRDRKIFAAPFDLGALKLTGAEVPMVDEVDDRAGLPEYSVSSNGTLVYRRASGRVVVRIDSAGRKQKVLGPGGYIYPRVSPDGKRLAVADVADPKGRVVVHDFASGATRRLVHDDRSQFNPTWTYDGQHIVFRSGDDTLITRADGASEPVLLFQDAAAYLTSFSLDGKWAAGFSQSPDKSEVWVAPVERGGVPLRIGRKAVVARGSAAALSPDGRWVAYMSDETGGYQVYLASLTEHRGAAGGKWQVSTVRGYDPRWTANGSQLFLQDERNGVSFHSTALRGDTFVPSDLRRFTAMETARYPAAGLDVMPDGKEIVEIVDADALTPETHLRVILNFSDEVRRRLARAK